MTRSGQRAFTHVQARFDALYRTYMSPLRQYFARRLDNRSEAEDLAHDLLIKIADRMEAGTIDNPEAFIFTAAGNVLRDRARHARIVAGYIQDSQVSGAHVEALSPEHVLMGKQSLDRLLDALKSLDQKSRDVFILHKLEGMKYAEIARLYGLSVSSIEKYMIKALAHIGNHAEL